MNGNERRGTVLTVCSSGQSAEVFEHKEVSLPWRTEKTVETVPNLIGEPDTGLKPGVNERSHFQTFEAKLFDY